MSDTPARRLSTGGLPPIKIRVEPVVEEAQSHNGVPCFTAWDRQEAVRVPDGWSLSEFDIDNKLPGLAIQIYDTTPGADDLDRLKALAEKLHLETRDEREELGGRSKHHRIDVWGMPLAADASDEERIAKCKAHHLSAEAASQDNDEAGFPITQLTDHEQYQRGILIVDRPQELWNEGEGGFLEVYWDVSPDYLEGLGRVYREEEHRDQTEVARYTRDELAQVLADFRDALGE